MVGTTINVVPATRAHLQAHDAAALRDTIFGHWIRVLEVMTCLTAAGTVLGASNVVQYTYDAAGNVVAIQRINPAPITLTGLVPATGPVGAVIAITGTGFSATPAGNAVAFNGVAAVVVSASPTTLTVAVPAGAITGKVTVTVGGNTATSAQDFVVSTSDFIVPPGGVAAADIIATTRLAADGPAQTIGLFTAGKYGLVLFDGIAGAWLSLHVGNFTVNPAGATIAYTIYKPDNTQFASGTLTATNLSIHLPALPVIGTYSLLLRTGIAQVSLDAKLETNAFVPADGTTLSIARSAGQSARALIAGVAGEQKALMVSGLVTVPANNSLDVTVALPNGSTFRRTSATGLGTTTLLPPFTTTGTHTVVLMASTGTTQSAFKVGLLGGGAIPVDGAAADVAIANPGEGARLTFAGVAGENLGLGVTGVALSPSSVTTTNISVYKPDASLFASVSCATDGTGCATNLENLPVTGTYSIIVQPSSGATGTQRLWLSHDVTGSLAGGVPLGVALSRPGQNARLTFAGTAGMLVALQVRAVATNPPGQGIAVFVRQPDKSLVAVAHLTGAGQTLVTPPAAGDWNVHRVPRTGIRGTGRGYRDDGSAARSGSRPRHRRSDARHHHRRRGWQRALPVRGSGGPEPRAWRQQSRVESEERRDGDDLQAGRGAARRVCVHRELRRLRRQSRQPAGHRHVRSRGASGCGRHRRIRRDAFVGSAWNIERRRFGAGADSRSTGAQRPTDVCRNRRPDAAPLLVGRRDRRCARERDRIHQARPSGSTFGNAIIANGVAGGYDIPALPATGNYTVFVDPPAGATLNATLQLVAR